MEIFPPQYYISTSLCWSWLRAVFGWWQFWRTKCDRSIPKCRDVSESFFEWQRIIEYCTNQQKDNSFLVVARHRYFFKSLFFVTVNCILTFLCLLFIFLTWLFSVLLQSEMLDTDSNKSIRVAVLLFCF